MLFNTQIILCSSQGNFISRFFYQIICMVEGSLAIYLYMQCNFDLDSGHHGRIMDSSYSYLNQQQQLLS